MQTCRDVDERTRYTANAERIAPTGLQVNCRQRV